MIKNIIGGICVGIANIIPGVSGGTIIVILGLFEKLMNSISNVFKIKVSKKERIEAIKFLLQFIIGVGIGLVVFAKIITFLFLHAKNQTLFCFAGLILFSIPTLKKNEMKDLKMNWLLFIVGVLVIGLLVYFSPGESNAVVTLTEILDKDFNILYALSLVFMGFISAATMIFPGVSGSMVLLILGWYHLFKGYVANVTSFEPMVLLGLVFIGIGVLLGIALSAKFTNFLLLKYRRGTMSLILGLIVMSSICILPVSGYNFFNTVTSILSFILGGCIVIGIEKLKNKYNAEK